MSEHDRIIQRYEDADDAEEPQRLPGVWSAAEWQRDPGEPIGGDELGFDAPGSAMTEGGMSG